MKISVLCAVLCCLGAFPAVGQSKNTFYIEGNVVFGELFDGYGANVVLANIAYSYEIKPLFRVGAGVGIGSANMLLNPIGEVERGTRTAYSMFGRLKYNFRPKPISMFCQLDGGFNISKVDDPQNNSYNGLGGFIAPSLGCDFSVGGNQRLFLTVGLQIQSYEYSEVTYKLNSAEFFVYDSHIQVRDWYTGLELIFGYSF